MEAISGQTANLGNPIGWRFVFPTIHPPGIYPPPKWTNIILPPGLTLVSGTLGPFPSITLLPGGSVTFEPEPPDCKTETAQLCETGTSFGVTSTDGTLKTTKTAVTSVCATVFGCDLSDEDKTKTTTDIAHCTAPPAIKARHVVSRVESNSPCATKFPGGVEVPDEPDDDPDWKGDYDGCTKGKDSILYPVANTNAAVKKIRRRLVKSKIEFWEIRADSMDYTAFFFIESLPADFMTKLNAMSGVR